MNNKNEFFVVDNKKQEKYEITWWDENHKCYAFVVPKTDAKSSIAALKLILFDNPLASKYFLLRGDIYE